MFLIDPLRDKRWPEIVARHPRSSVFHTVDWLSSLHSAYGYEPVVYAAGNGSELDSGMVFCKVKSWITGRRLVSLPFSDHCDPLVENSAQFDELLPIVRQSVDREKLSYCEVRPFHFVPDASTLLGKSDGYALHLVDLKFDDQTIFRRFHNSTQRKIRRAEREALTYDEGNSERLLAQFYKLLIQTRRRHSVPPQPIRWFRSLIASFGPNLKIRMAFKDGVPIASILTLNHKKTVTYKYGCSEAKSHPLGGVAMLFWKTIQQSRAEGFEVLDLGRSDPLNKGLSTFKEHLGGIHFDLSYWRYPDHQRFDQSPWKKKLVERIVNAAPERLLALTGDLLYPHLG